ncbi:Mitotic spindle checkpoint protein BUBR1 [Raphanus sativus]|nr:Mitotic spindle checkpoint protein BUBR1 [Raphanus sativus]
MKETTTKAGLDFITRSRFFLSLKRGHNLCLLKHNLKSHTDRHFRPNLFEKQRKLIKDIDEYDGDEHLFPWIELNDFGKTYALAHILWKPPLRSSTSKYLDAKPMENLNDAYKKLMVITMRRLKTVDEEAKKNDLPSRSFVPMSFRGDNIEGMC